MDVSAKQYCTVLYCTVPCLSEAGVPGLRDDGEMDGEYRTARYCTVLCSTVQFRWLVGPASTSLLIGVSFGASNRLLTWSLNGLSPRLESWPSRTVSPVAWQVDVREALIRACVTW